jgi:tetratricopeptide (TPR) repeat protein
VNLAPGLIAALRSALNEEPDWQALLRHFDFNEGFALIFLFVESAENAEVCREALGDHLRATEKGTIRLIAPEGPEDAFHLPYFLHQPEGLDRSETLWIESVIPEGSVAPEKLEEWRKAWRACFASLNQVRNTMQRTIPGALVFVFAPWMQVLVRNIAPDLWSIRSTVARISLRLEPVSSRQMEPAPERVQPEAYDGPDPEYALKVAETLRGKPGLESQLADVLLRAGRGFFEQYRFERAIPVLEEVYALRKELSEQSSGPDNATAERALADAASWLGRAYLRVARYNDAEPLLRRALEIDESIYDPDHPEVAIRLNNLAQLLLATNRLAEAEPLMRRALEIDERSYGSDHPIVAIRLNNLAQLLQATNRLAEAEPLMRCALEIDEANYGPNHPNVARDLNNLALLLKDTNRLDEVEPLMRRALEIDERNYGPDHPEVAIDLNNLGQLLNVSNRFAEAEPLVRRALEIDETSYGPDHPIVAIRLNNLAQLLKATDRVAEAAPLMRRALEIAETSYGPDHPEVATDLNNLALLLQVTNRLDEAEPLMRRALEIDGAFRANNGYEHPNAANHRANYRFIAKQLGWSEEKIQQALQAPSRQPAAESQ